MRSLATYALIFVLPAAQALAQSQARVTGTITDNTGAVVSGATVSVRNVDTGVVTTATTNSVGIYSLPFVNPGQYDLTCEMSGFKKFVRAGLTLETGTAATVNVELQLGAVTETVNVQAQAVLLETESGALGQLIENKNIANMPVASRRSASLVRMMGNVSYTSEDGAEQVPKFSMAGGRSTNQMWHLDGGVTQNMAIGVPQLSLNPPNESLQEFKALTNSYPAEFGRTGGGVILMTTRSGTNEFHGSAYEWLRNDKLNSRTFFSDSKAPLRYNIFGASAGGPVIKNRTFFFVNYEGTRRRTGVTVPRIVPNPGEVDGNFSARRDFVLLDPATRVGTTAAQPFAGNIIPSSRIDPVARAFAALYPLPNQPGQDPTRAPGNNFRANGSDALTQDYITGRVDHTLTNKDRIYARISWVRAPEYVAAVYPVQQIDDRAGTRLNRHKNYLGNWQRSITPTVINELRYMYGNRMHINRGAVTGSGLNEKLGLKGVEGTAGPRINITGLSPLGQTPHERIQDPILTQQVTDNLLWVRGSHSLKAGFELRYSKNKDIFNQTYGGQFSFNERATNNGLAAMLMGWAASGDLNKADILETRTDYYGVYVQDDWKVSSKLTLNVGVRWELDTPRWEQSNRQSGFNGTAINPVSGTPGIVTFAGMDGVGKYSHSTDKNNVGPRLGFAWQAVPRFVVRGGYGISYNGAYAAAVPNSMAQGFSLNGSFTSPDGGFTQALLFRDGMPAITREPLGPGYGAVRVGQAVRAAPDYIDFHHTNSYSQQWNLTLQKELLGNLLLEGAYIANVAHNLGGPNVNINQIPLVNGRGPAVQAQTARPFPQFGNVTRISPNWGNSSYHSMNLKVEKRYSNGLNFLGNYTWSKFLDDVETGTQSGGQAGNGYQHIDARNLNKGPSGSDIRHRVTFSSVYELPVGKGRRLALNNRVADFVAGGWGVGAIFEVHTGVPWGVVEQTNRLNTFSDSQRPNLLRDPTLDGSRPRADFIRQWFDTSAFAAPGDGIMGSAARISGYGPGLVELDLSVHKRFAVTEKSGMIFRAEFFNLPNRPNFAQPASTRGAGPFGTINNIVGSAREIQLGLRFEF
ncbi:MAG TPA: TonB-dependent receptor [Bryobacteraceae bacterium]|nr:TonB-dependent receptor [Bryobacteraceae bacterium]